MKVLPVALLTISLSVPACDLVVEAGTELVVGNRGTVFGSGATPTSGAGTAVWVKPGGRLIVADADLVGGGVIVDNRFTPSFGEAGKGIFVDTGFVRVVQGTLRGGPTVIAVLPRETPHLLDAPGPAITATDARVEIEGGTLIGGALVKLVPGDPPIQPGIGVFVVDTTLVIKGGTIVGGVVQSDPPSQDPQRAAVRATFSDVEIRGGVFMGPIEIDVADADVFGGDFRDGIRVNDDIFAESRFKLGVTRIFGGRAHLRAGSCVEVHGGQLLGVAQTTSVGRVIFFGTNLSVDAGAAVASTSTRITGTLESGDPLDVVVEGRAARSGFSLAAPGGAGCPPDDVAVGL